MMRMTPAVIGMLLMFSAAKARAEDSVYERMKVMSEQELLYGDAELEVETHLVSIYPEKIGTEEEDLKREQVDQALKKQYLTLCGEQALPASDCKKHAERITTLVQDAETIRSLGRDLQAIASSYEMGLYEYPGRAIAIAARLPSIARFWQSTTDRLTSPVTETGIRTAPYADPDGMQAEFEALEQNLNDLITEEGNKKDREKLIAAVWRYQYGFQAIKAKGDPPCTSDDVAGADGTDLQYMKARFCTVELSLEALWNLVPHDNEVALFPTHTFDDLGIIVWITTADAGLLWKMPLDPVLPSLNCSDVKQKEDTLLKTCVNSAVLGGAYPDEPAAPPMGTGLCSLEFGRRGYLCRHVESQECTPLPLPSSSSSASSKSSTPPPPAASLFLTGCKVSDFRGHTRETRVGPEVCGAGGWRNTVPQEYNGTWSASSQSSSSSVPKDTKEIGDAVLPSWCSKCAVDLFCSDACGPALPSWKDGGGTVHICMENDLHKLGGYDLLRGLVHAQQLCNRGFGASLFDAEPSCCATAYEGALVACNAMAEDGILVLRQPAISIADCADTLANATCTVPSSSSSAGKSSSSSSAGGVCTYHNTGKLLEELQIRVAASNTPLSKATCGSSFDDLLPDPNNSGKATVDPRPQEILNSLPRVCQPGCNASYENTIGNNLCYIGQCIEQSLEEQRLLAGRLGLRANDQSFPWEFCAVPKTDGGKQFGESVVLPALPTTTFPPYEPLELLTSLERKLCQFNGLPVLNPPIRCGFDVLRSLDLPLTDPLRISVSLTNQPEEVRQAMEGVERMVPAVGTRVSTELSLHYMKKAAGAFGDILGAVSSILEDIGDISFPDTMCPRNSEGSCP